MADLLLRDLFKEKGKDGGLDQFVVGGDNLVVVGESQAIAQETDVWRQFHVDLARFWFVNDPKCRNAVAYDTGGSKADSSPVAEDGRWVSTRVHDQDLSESAPEPKPLYPALAAGYPLEIRARETILQYQQRQVGDGKQAAGVFDAKDVRKLRQVEVGEWVREEG